VQPIHSSHLGVCLTNRRWRRCRSRPRDRATARPRIAAIVENNVVRDDYGQPEPAFGYRPIGVTDNPIASCITTLTVDAGSVFRESTVMLKVGDPSLAPTDPAIVNYPRFRQALNAMTALWQPTWS
jgi:hypothetical protein